MVASGLGVTVLPKTALTERYATPLVKAVPFAEPRPKRRIAVAWRRRETGEGRSAATSSLHLRHSRHPWRSRPNAVRKLIEAVKSVDLPVELLGGAE
jgi:DNA-binding transcriptional LysR family regulator